MKIHIIMHESFEAPGAIEDWARKKSHSISYTRCHEGDNFPSDFSSFDFLIIMGGPQSPSTTSKDCPHFNGKIEKQFIKKAIDLNKAVLGICLGAQLIGDSLGGSFEHSPKREIGVFEATLTKEALDDPIFSKFPQKFLVGHWHGDMPGLTKDSVILAYSKGCPRQIIRYATIVYGFQCHFEFTQHTIDTMIKNCTDELERYKDLPYIETADQLKKHEFKEMNELLFMFLDFIENQISRHG